MEYKVIAGEVLLGRTSDFAEAVKWMNLHNETSVGGVCAHIEECE